MDPNVKHHALSSGTFISFCMVYFQQVNVTVIVGVRLRLGLWLYGGLRLLPIFAPDVSMYESCTRCGLVTPKAHIGRTES